MFARVKRAVMGRRKTVAIVATVLVAGAATALAVLPNAEASDSLGSGQAPTKQFRDALGKVRKLPPGAQRVAHGTLPKPGARPKAFSDPVKSPRIVGGVPANASDFKYIVGIQTDFVGDVEPDGTLDWFRATCTGTIISPTKVLTAGHCATDFTLGDSVVIAGANTLRDASDNVAGFVARVQSTWTHPSFNAAQIYAPNSNAVPLDDVSVLTLTQPLPAVYTPVDLAPAGSPTDYDETAALILGYGVTSNANTATAGTLFEATVPIHSSANCTTNMAPAGPGYDNSRMLCAGTLGTPAAPGVDACHGDSGGPILVGATEVGITDWGFGDCAVSFYGVYERISTYRTAIDADLAWPGVINPDWSGDGQSDLIVRNSAGELGEYSGSGFVDDGLNGFNPVPARIGTGWNGFNKLFRVMNWDGDGSPAIMARSANGNLYKYKSDGHGSFSGGAVQVGSSWNGFTDIMVTNNWTGDHHPNILGRKANGDLILYTSNGAGGWENNGQGIKIGSSWNGFNTVLTPGDWKGDGHQALIGRTPNGNLFLYESDGAGGWVNNGQGVQIGSSWNGFKIFMSPGDWGGDNKVDLLGIEPGGAMKLYQTDGHGNWLNGGVGRQIGSGWNGFTAVF